MDRKQLVCNLCNVTLSDARAEESHLIGKKHQLALHNSLIYDRKKRCGVFIGGLPNMVPKEEILKFLSDLGPTTDIFIAESNKFAFLDFKEERTAQELIRKKYINYMGSMLSVKARIPKKPEDQKKVPTTETDSESVIASLKNITDFDEQMITLLYNLQPNQEERLWQYKLLCEDLRRCLQEIFPGCSVYPFGSTITRLNFKDSDVDIYVDLTNTPNFVKENSSQYVKKARNALPKYRLFSNLLAIPKAKTPIVKCVHIQTNISCDFNFKNMLGVCNSYLIRHYMTLAPNILWVLLILKFWGRVHEFTGPNNKFSNYALIMLFIFFIQQEPYKVESVLNMQKVKGTENMQHGWNGGFKPTESSNTCLTNRPIIEILSEFFEYYSKFDYNLNIICPYLGKAVSKIDFFKLETLNDAFLLYKINVAMLTPLAIEVPLCIQDPFEHNYNLTQRISTQFMQDFVSQCTHSAQLLRNTDKCPVLYKLFTEEPPEGKFKYNNKCEFKIGMRSLLQYIEHKVPSDATDKASEIKKIWYKTMNEFVIKFLLTVLKFHVEVLKEEPETEDTVTTAVDSVTFHCTGKYNIWESRRTVAKDIDLSKIESLIDREAEITNYIINVLCKNIIFDKPIIDFYMTLYACESPIQMDFVLTNISSVKGFFKTLCTFLANRLPHMFNVYEEELNKTVLQLPKDS